MSVCLCMHVNICTGTGRKKKSKFKSCTNAMKIQMQCFPSGSEGFPVDDPLAVSHPSLWQMDRVKLRT